MHSRTGDGLPSGVICVKKPKGLTSHDVVYKIKKLTGKKTGHTGTLDPEAEGVLPVCLGSATKIADYLTASDKEYLVEIIFGAETDTQDSTGTVLREAALNAGEDAAKSVIMGFRGSYLQVPPMYSAIKVSGKKLYELAREGKEVVREPRPVNLRYIEICEFNYPNRALLKVGCSKGAYMRTLCHDIGRKLDCCAHMGHLLRTGAGGFRLEDSHLLDELYKAAEEGKLAEYIIPLEEVPAFSKLKKACVKADYERLLFNGNPLNISCFIGITHENVTQNEKILVYSADGNRLQAIYGVSFDEDGKNGGVTLRAVTMLRQ